MPRGNGAFAGDRMPNGEGVDPRHFGAYPRQGGIHRLQMPKMRVKAAPKAGGGRGVAKQNEQ